MSEVKKIPCQNCEMYISGDILSVNYNSIYYEIILQANVVNLIHNGVFTAEINGTPPTVTFSGRILDQRMHYPRATMTESYTVELSDIVPYPRSKILNYSTTTDVVDIEGFVEYITPMVSVSENLRKINADKWALAFPNRGFVIEFGYDPYLKLIRDSDHREYTCNDVRLEQIIMLVACPIDLEVIEPDYYINGVDLKFRCGNTESTLIFSQ